MLPPLNKHVDKTKASGGVKQLFDIVKRPVVLWGMLSMMLAMWAAFMIVPNISGFLQYNGGLPRGDLGSLYLVGGLASIFSLRLGGKFIDAKGSVWVAKIITVFLVATMFLGFGMNRPMIEPHVLFALFMMTMSLRNISLNTLTSKIPRQEERARFQSLQSATQHLACGLGAMTSTFVLYEDRARHIAGMDRLTIAACLITALVPLAMIQTNRRIVHVH
jgi:predicted MFS family arabinose efflux permease